MVLCALSSSTCTTWLRQASSPGRARAPEDTVDRAIELFRLSFEIANVDFVQRPAPGRLGTSMDYAQLLARLFLGSHPQSIDDIERLRQEAGIRAVLNLQTDDDMRSVNLVWGPSKPITGAAELSSHEFR